MMPNDTGFRKLAEDLLEELGVNPTPDRMIAVLQFMKDVIHHALGRAILKSTPTKREARRQ